MVAVQRLGRTRANKGEQAAFHGSQAATRDDPTGVADTGVRGGPARVSVPTVGRCEYGRRHAGGRSAVATTATPGRPTRARPGLVARGARSMPPRAQPAHHTRGGRDPPSPQPSQSHAQALALQPGRDGGRDAPSVDRFHTAAPTQISRRTTDKDGGTDGIDRDQTSDDESVVAISQSLETKQRDLSGVRAVIG